MENFFKHGEIGGKRKTMLECLKSDLYRYEGKTTWKSFIKYYRKNAGFRFLVAYRLVNEKGIGDRALSLRTNNAIILSCIFIL